MRLSIIIPFLNSHELVRRQILWFKKLDLPDEVETIFMDDGSNPPLTTNDPPRNFRIIATNDKRPWTSSLARNTAAKIAKGAYFLMIDGDYIVTSEAVERGLSFTGDREGFRRHFGVLDENGDLKTDEKTLFEYGLNQDYYRKCMRQRNGRISPHPNQFIIRREVFEMIGGYDESRILNRSYPQGEDRQFKRDLKKLAEEGKINLEDGDQRAKVYMLPNGQFCADGCDVDYNPFGLMHTLTRKTANNYWHHHPKLLRGREKVLNERAY